MNTEIKFRWVGRNKWFNEIEINDNLTTAKIRRGECFSFFSESNRLPNGNCEFLAEELYTGLKDRKGMDIYEGDYEEDILGRHKLVEYHHGGFWLRSIETGFSERLTHDHQIYISGNIHENPELLK